MRHRTGLLDCPGGVRELLTTGLHASRSKSPPAPPAYPHYICILPFSALFQISDDDRMSLTTAVSDEDDGESVMASPYKAKATGTAAASFNCTGAVRKAG